MAAGKYVQMILKWSLNKYTTGICWGASVFEGSQCCEFGLQKLRD